jgi:hypothetical protein
MNSVGSNTFNWVAVGVGVDVEPLWVLLSLIHLLDNLSLSVRAWLDDCG